MIDSVCTIQCGPRDFLATSLSQPPPGPYLQQLTAMHIQLQQPKGLLKSLDCCILDLAPGLGIAGEHTGELLLVSCYCCWPDELCYTPSKVPEGTWAKEPSSRKWRGIITVSIITLARK